MVLFLKLIWSNIFNLDKKEENSVNQEENSVIQSKFSSSDLRQKENDSQVCFSVFNIINVSIKWDNKCR